MITMMIIQNHTDDEADDADDGGGGFGMRTSVPSCVWRM